MRYDKPIIIQKMNEDNEKWEDLYMLHAHVNKANGSEYFDQGVVKSKVNRVFEIRYFKALEEIAFQTGLYRIVYRDHIYNILDYDDFMEQHKSIKLLGVASI